MQMRELKALELAARSRITFDGERWVVPSQSTGGTANKTSAYFPTSANAFQSTNAGGWDVFIAKISRTNTFTPPPPTSTT